MGELTPGTPLRLEDLARSLGMSISPIREAVRQLEALGLAEHVPHHGAKVMGLDVEELRELFSIRLALETMAVRRAAELFGPADDEAARAHLAAFDDARHRADTRVAVREHTAFHFTLYEASGSGWLAPADPAGVGQLRAVPARPPRRERRAAGPARGARRRAARGLRRPRSRAGRGGPACPPRARDRHLRSRAQGPQHLRLLDRTKAALSCGRCCAPQSARRPSRRALVWRGAERLDSAAGGGYAIPVRVDPASG